MSFWNQVAEKEKEKSRRSTARISNTSILSERTPLAPTQAAPLTRASRSFAQIDTLSHDRAADELSDGLLALNTDDEDVNYQKLRQSLRLGDDNYGFSSQMRRSTSVGSAHSARLAPAHLPRASSASAARYNRPPPSVIEREGSKSAGSLLSMDIAEVPLGTAHLEGILEQEGSGVLPTRKRHVGAICCVAVLVLVSVAGMLFLGEIVVGPPSQPAGPYRLLERQEGSAFWDSYVFYEGPDSVGSNGYINYVSKAKAFELGIAKVITEPVKSAPPTSPPSTNNDNVTANADSLPNLQSTQTPPASPKTEDFIYMASSPTPEGPRNSVRLEGKRRFNRGLFILSLEHMPTGCGTWPAFWLVDEANWPVNGEIDILEAVNFQTEAKTALHSTKTCVMDDVPQGVKTGTWDTAVGIPDRKTGIPDMTMRYAKDCYVYNPHQWLNQGCVAVDDVKGRIGGPLNEKGGGVYALEWDPINRHIRSWIFTPHKEIPENLQESIRTAGLSPAKQVLPDPNQWGLPYAYFAVGDNTSCPASHFKNMRLVFNLAFCGSVSGNRYFMDCPEQFKQFPTCNQYVKSNPKALEEAYWKIKGVYVYERQWQKVWL